MKPPSVVASSLITKTFFEFANCCEIPSADAIASDKVIGTKPISIVFCLETSPRIYIFLLSLNDVMETSS